MDAPTARRSLGGDHGQHCSGSCSADQGSTPTRGGVNTTALLTVVNGALVGVGSVYLTTHSVLVTLVASVSSVILGALALFAR